MATVENLKKEMITKTDLAQTAQRLDKTHTSVESLKNELTNVITTVQNMKIDTNGKFSIIPKFEIAMPKGSKSNEIYYQFNHIETSYQL
jgi:prefoldin subunit 5